MAFGKQLCDFWEIFGTFSQNSTCENAPGDLLWLFATLTFLSLLLTSILSIGWTVCIGHPGRQRDTPPLVAKDASYHTVTETEFGHK